MVQIKDEIENGNDRAKARLQNTPTALAARYDHPTQRLVIDLNSGLSIAFKAQDAQGLEHATPAQLKKIHISPSGFGLYFPALDVDIYIPALLAGFMGSRQWMASQMGQRGGKAKSFAKRAAARSNGKLGGRPSKISAAKRPDTTSAAR